MKVKVFGSLREITNCIEFEINGKNIEELLKKASKKFGIKFSKIVFDKGKIRNEITILLNGKNIIHMKGLKTKIGKEDVVSMFPPIGGG
ncbi:MAG: ubiquitin-like small modifier protein 1 [Candidatus Thermoplasmatota archaeon]